MHEAYIPSVFTHHNRHLHALLLENQPWFCARDLGRLMGVHLNDRMVSKLDEDQRHVLLIRYHGQPEKRLMLSESGVYALLVYHYAPGNRLLREWLTHQVVPAMRDAQAPSDTDRPMLSVLDWPEMSMILLHWQNDGWIRLRDMPCLLLNRTRGRARSIKPWWRRLLEVFHVSGHSVS
ncbi:Bro-N domain-containing protein [Pseudomonas sp. B21-056]|jgi:prophage antirepressor-like protein|uniref:BRO-N domain-containing protein n=1 Tax=Pseudomonas sp. B21-056 TaxID=2895495 RepID=UPI0022311234|nr:Bro-N domain-containing protein [Pseudomonas sp. B21-056]UZE22510.1 Bro-N domain-containing protein [Pseudomonas sp. B21-056]